MSNINIRTALFILFFRACQIPFNGFLLVDDMRSHHLSGFFFVLFFDGLTDRIVLIDQLQIPACFSCATVFCPSGTAIKKLPPLSN